MPAPSDMKFLGMDPGSNQPPAVAYTKKYAYDGDSNIEYEGWAKSAQDPATSGAIWAVKKYSYAAGLIATEQWADGDTNEDNIWDNRASLTYK